MSIVLATMLSSHLLSLEVGHEREGLKACVRLNVVDADDCSLDDELLDDVACVDRRRCFTAVEAEPAYEQVALRLRAEAADVAWEKDALLGSYLRVERVYPDFARELEVDLADRVPLPCIRWLGLRADLDDARICVEHDLP